MVGTTDEACRAVSTILVRKEEIKGTEWKLIAGGFGREEPR
jgi:hypothetical protein